ncbi:MAG: ester cyclase [Rhodothermales bacterium]
MTDKQRNLDLQKQWGDAVASGDLDKLDDILADDFVDHDPGDQSPDREGVKAFFRGFRQAFPDLKPEPIELHADDNGYVTMRYNVSGTHKGEFMGFAPTGRRFETSAMQMARFEDGQCVERWGVTDQLQILKQLGLVDVPNDD